ncbi:hypothetical protein [Terracoccus luteus]|jgi:hypothetical protein|uniref:Uncharacterized protein n=1 Tax=Terracoccus luteus TaxID=53356 RepID=A0A839PU11_9MICO|nr:hypothetical protein [Terracoccus luteus]MBB2986244.1 hypothetical protein [Terracoccus luteus]MCP2172166.1 hypothetical protein [Terracoccus luteus]
MSSIAHIVRSTGRNPHRLPTVTARTYVPRSERPRDARTGRVEPLTAFPGRMSPAASLGENEHEQRSVA